MLMESVMHSMKHSVSVKRKPMYLGLNSQKAIGKPKVIDFRLLSLKATLTHSVRVKPKETLKHLAIWIQKLMHSVIETHSAISMHLMRHLGFWKQKRMSLATLTHSAIWKQMPKRKVILKLMLK